MSRVTSHGIRPLFLHSRLFTLATMCLGVTAKTGKPRAILFDFDGSLAQSEEAHRKRFVAACGVECDVDRWMDHCVGQSTEWIVDYLTGACEPAVLDDLRARATYAIA